MSTKPSIAIIGAGIGGLALAGLLSRQGANVRVYEQAKEFQRIGAGIQMSPNAVRVLRALGLEPQLAPAGLRAARVDRPRVGHRRVPVRADLRRRGGEAVRRALSADASRRSARGALLRRAAGADRLREEARRPRPQRRRRDAALCRRRAAPRRMPSIGADGVHSLVREILLGPEKPKFTGRVAHRTVFPAALLGDFVVDTCTKWWGPDRHIVDLSRELAARRALLRHQRARSRLGRGILVDARRDGRGSSRRWPASTTTCSACWRPAPACTSGRCSSAIRCRAGRTARSCCSATPAIR